MKLIIDIPEDYYKSVKEKVANGNTYPVKLSIAHGIPLDDVKAEIEHMACRQYEHRLTLDRQEVIEILDNIGKADMRGDT